MKQLITLGILVFLTGFTSKAKVRNLYIKTILAEATTIRKVEIYAYTGSYMLCGIIGSKDTLKIKCSLKQPNPVKNSELAGSWPKVHEKVLIILNKGKLILFAKSLDKEYRFWDPNSGPFNNSIFIFPNDAQYKPVPICYQIFRNEAISSCIDGCLVIKSSVKERG